MHSDININNHSDTFVSNPTSLSFENTAIAFASKTTKELKHSSFVFKMINTKWVSSLSIRLIPMLIKGRMPFIRKITKDTIFQQFIGGETLEEMNKVIAQLHYYQMYACACYCVEVQETEEEFERVTQQIIYKILWASSQKNVPFVSLKVSSIARFSLLAKLHKAPRIRSGIHNNEIEVAEWNRVEKRLWTICNIAKEKNIKVLIDAEESWIQDPIDRLVIEMMEQFNTKDCIVYNTIQMYRRDRLDFLSLCIRIAKQKKIIFGVKLVRGAYMEKEREKAVLAGHACLINTTKEQTDQLFDKAMAICFDHIGLIAIVIASHNEKSNLLAYNLMQEKNIPLNIPRVFFSQLYGMGDNISYNLAKVGCNVAKFIPYGIVENSIPYMIRRAKENKSIEGLSSRELVLIQSELLRRKYHH